MQNPRDVSHIDKQIQKDRVNIDAARAQAENERRIADQRRGEGNDTGATYYEQEADRFEQQAADLEQEVEQLEVQKERVQKRITELEDLRASIDKEHSSRLAQIDQELNDLRGSSFML